MSSAKKKPAKSEVARSGGTLSETQKSTQSAFGFKWSQTLESEGFDTFYVDWLVGKYLQGDRRILEEWLPESGGTILEVGCGQGHSALCLFGDFLKRHKYFGFDLSTSVPVAKSRFARLGYPGSFARADLFRLPVPDDSADLILAEGVLHHTDSTAGAVKALAPKLCPGGRLMFYVYAKKGPVREFTDDYVRDYLANMTDEEAWEVLKPLTHLGIALGELDREVAVPEDIPFLGIKAGPIPVQRLFYWYFAKMFYRPELKFDEMHLINFDWYRPVNCLRHTPEEVREFCKAAGLRVEHMHIEPSGITVISQRV